MATKNREAATGLLLADKPKGLTSHDAVGRVRRAFGQREVGHTGTLDPLATGLLVLALGRATRIARFVEASEKTYVGTVHLGRSTATFDAEGEVIEERAVGTIAREAIDRALASLVGTIEQRVPAYSAVKVGGERLYARARRGEEVEAPVRAVTIHALRALDVALPEVVIEARVSKGTYIRSLAVQIGERLALPAHLSALRRTSVGAFSIAEAIALDAIRGEPFELVSIERALAALPSIRCEGRMIDDVRHGRPLRAGAIRARIAGKLARGAEVSLIDAASGAVLAVGVAELSTEELDAGPEERRAISYACVLTPPIPHA